MARHIEAWMDGVRLGDIGDIVIRDVSEPAPEMEIEYTGRPALSCWTLAPKADQWQRTACRVKRCEQWLTSVLSMYA